MTGFLSALEVPKLKSRINDYANIISPAYENEIAKQLQQLEQTDSTQVVVLTIKSLEGDSLEDFSIRVAEKWKIGQKKLDNGAILLVSRDDRKIRIETGYGLEGKLTDLISGRIIRDAMAPEFRLGKYYQGILKGVLAISSVVKGEYAATAETAKRRTCLLYTSPSPRDVEESRMPSSA